MQENYEPIFSAYTSVRDGHYPFPVESILAFTLALNLSRDLSNKGDLLEIGVEFGGTALLTAQVLQEGETLHLIDLKRTDRFAASFDTLSAQQQAQISFHECSSRSPALEDLTKGTYRFMHIDGGHSKEDVHDDAHRFAALLAPKGIVVFDDVFEIRWPGVTEAVFEYLADAPIAPFMIVDRKLYCTRKEDHAEVLAQAREMMTGLEAFGHIHSWVEPYARADTLIAKITPTAETRKVFA
jgi:hypothetical protein